MVSGIAFAQPFIQTHTLSCDWINDICKAVYDLAMRIIKSICDCFGGTRSFVPSETTTTNTRGATMQGPLNLVLFYRGLEPNNNAVTLDQILAWDDGQLESVHNYIQWLFPLTSPSAPNPTAAVLDNPTIQTFKGDPALKNQVLRSFRRMLAFYGLQMNEATKVITRAPNFNARAAVWLINPAGHHNFLRITRIIHSMDLLGLPDYSRSFFAIMQDIERNEGRGIIGDYTLNCWRGACPR